MLNCNYILDYLCLYYNQNTTDVVAIFYIYSYDINIILLHTLLSCGYES